ncbi:MAG: YceD family protein [bacterium]
MKVKVTDVGKEGISADFEIRGRDLDLGSDIGCKVPVKVHATLQHTRDGIYVSGWVSTTIKLVCSRCAEEFDYKLFQEFATEYREMIGSLEEEIELKEEDLDVVFYDGVEIDLMEEARQNILYAIPMKPLCKEDCRGICPRCGANLNTDECTCAPEADTPFAALRGLCAKNP